MRAEDLAIASQRLSTADEANVAVYEEWQRRFARGVFTPLRQPPSAADDGYSDGDAHSDAAAAVAARSENKDRVLQAARSMLLMNKLVSFVGQRSPGARPSSRCVRASSSPTLRSRQDKSRRVDAGVVADR